MVLTYEDRVRGELRAWQRELLRPPGLLERTTKKVQTKINSVIPEKVHAALTAAVRGTVKSVLFGLDYMPKGLPQLGLTLEERDVMAQELLSKYKKIAAAEGAGAGAGGFVLGLVDFPALIAIKMKLLFEMSHVYGYHTADYRERLYLLYVFQLAFTSQEKRLALFEAVHDWGHTSAQWPVGEGDLQQVDWEQFQCEYRDSIDFRKMLQLVPGIGAVVGAWANYGLVEDLGTVGIRCFQMRHLE